MNREQQLLYDLLVRLDAFFAKHGIIYYLDGGTAIGALRHHGFLPWDDDADIYVTRGNYDKLLLCADQLFEEGIDLACYERYPNYSKTAAKFTDLRTTMLVKSDIFHGRSNGQNIDVFVLDPVPREKEAEHNKYLSIYEELLNYNYVVNKRIKNYYWEYYFFYILSKILGKNKILDYLYKKLTAYSEDESDCYILRWGQIPMTYEKYMFGKPRLVKFENHLFPCAEYTEDFLRTQFGYDWFVIPEADNQQIHNLYVHNEISGNNYYNDFKRFINLKKAVHILEQRKCCWVKDIDNQEITEEFVNLMRWKAIEEEFKRQLVELDLETCFANKRYAEILKKTEIISKNEAVFRNARILPPLTIDEYYIFLYTLTVSGMFYRADKFYNLLLKEKEKLQKRFDDIKNTIEINKCLSVEIQNARWNNVEDLCGTCKPLEDNIDIVRAKVLLALRNERIESFKSYVKLCNDFLQLHPYDGDLKKLKGDLLLRLNEKREARRAYQEALKTTRNGIIILELTKLLSSIDEAGDNINE